MNDIPTRESDFPLTWESILSAHRAAGLSGDQIVAQSDAWHAAWRAEQARAADLLVVDRAAQGRAYAAYLARPTKDRPVSAAQWSRAVLGITPQHAGTGRRIADVIDAREQLGEEPLPPDWLGVGIEGIRTRLLAPEEARLGLREPQAAPDPSRALGRLQKRAERLLADAGAVGPEAVAAVVRSVVAAATATMNRVDLADVLNDAQEFDALEALGIELEPAKFKFGHQNTKMREKTGPALGLRMVDFSLLAGKGGSCGPASAFCESICYALENVHQAALKAWERQLRVLEACQGDRAVIGMRLSEALAPWVSKGYGAVRIHSSGAFDTRGPDGGAAYRDAWLDVIRAHPDLIFLAYVKAVRLFTGPDAPELPSNLFIRYSLGGAEDRHIPDHALREVTYYVPGPDEPVMGDERDRELLAAAGFVSADGPDGDAVLVTTDQPVMIEWHGRRNQRLRPKLRRQMHAVMKAELRRLGRLEVATVEVDAQDDDAVGVEGGDVEHLIDDLLSAPPPANYPNPLTEAEQIIARATRQQLPFPATELEGDWTWQRAAWVLGDEGWPRETVHTPDGPQTLWVPREGPSAALAACDYDPEDFWSEVPPDIMLDLWDRLG